MEGKTITATLEFRKHDLHLEAVYSHCQADIEQAALEQALERLLKPKHTGVFKRLFRKSGIL